MMSSVKTTLWLLSSMSCLAATPCIAADDKPLSPFGIGSCYINNRSVEDNSRWLPQMASIGLTAYRTPHAVWGALERKRGEWSWADFDAQMTYLDKHSFQFGCLLIGNPSWNKGDAPGHLPVNNLEGWSNYVSELAKRVKGRATRLEVWNEPPNFTGKDQTPKDYAKIVVAAYRAAKAVDPSFRIGLAAKSVHINYLEQTIRAGAKDHFDFIVLHPYEVLDGIADGAGSDAVYFNIVPTVRRMLAKVNPERKNVPVMFTELGVDAKKGLGPQAYGLVKAYVLGIAQDVECVQWFEGRDGDSGPMGLLDGDGLPRPAYHALATMIRHFSKHPKYLGWTRLGEHGTAFAFEGAEGTVLAAWGTAGSPTTAEFTQEIRLVDPPTGTITNVRQCSLGVAPVFILGAPESMIAAARANRDKPLEWGGDFTTAKEVSVEYGEKTVERGLHTRSGAHVAKAVVAYGGSARAGDVPGGNAFIVDPGFLTYDALPIEIAVEVRRNAANDNSGFKLVYESTTGFKTAGHWYTVPDNKHWHTVRWRIDDPQFVNYWGFNFALESDGNQYNKYLIRKATVRKLE
jgi:polysaccharide biosynthesis protein PslG